MRTEPPEPTDLEFFELLTGSFLRLVGKPLLEQGQGPDWLYREVSTVILAHDTEPDPRFIYANVAAQKRFEYGWDEFIGMPSRLSAEAPDRAERQLLLEAVERQGFIADYRGLRVKKSGKRFWMEHGVVWQLVDGSGERHGQAAAFSSWTDL
ncbi:MEKHLA domain-containing protein [Rhizobium grahamii]|uniref:MEKHLA domain-containing protein n=1 Tax=Rhizobium grahamii CCGE 502 TaxID=990285 RepID=S3H8U4_9HYPH|nr:MEKHLA domain-containing protein [Rhizobium grahamii]EPE95014.1 MEKHLA domain-containing protein [Rhizobium grahamii CCGE 502]